MHHAGRDYIKTHSIALQQEGHFDPEETAQLMLFMFPQLLAKQASCRQLQAGTQVASPLTADLADGDALLCAVPVAPAPRARVNTALVQHAATTDPALGIGEVGGLRHVGLRVETPVNVVLCSGPWHEVFGPVEPGDAALGVQAVPVAGHAGPD